MLKLLEGEDGHVLVVGDDDDDDDVTCCLPLRRRRTLLTPHHQSDDQHKSGRESKRECFVVSLLHFQGRVSTFPTVEWRGKIVWREANDRICTLRKSHWIVRNIVTDRPASNVASCKDQSQ